jgi:hypothetical protein
LNTAALREGLKALSAPALLHFGILPDERSSDDPIKSITRALGGGHVPTKDSYEQLRRLIDEALSTVPPDTGGGIQDAAARTLLWRLYFEYWRHTGRRPLHRWNPKSKRGDYGSDFTRMVFEVIKFLDPPISEEKADKLLRHIGK